MVCPRTFGIVACLGHLLPHDINRRLVQLAHGITTHCRMSIHLTFIAVGYPVLWATLRVVSQPYKRLRA
jgi:hypothetical protein